MQQIRISWRICKIHNRIILRYKFFKYVRIRTNICLLCKIFITSYILFFLLIILFLLLLLEILKLVFIFYITLIIILGRYHLLINHSLS
jgi:hypothetical protein